MLKFVVCTAALAATVVTPAPGLARQQEQGIVIVAEPVTLSTWSQRTTKLLERHMVYPHYMLGALPREGVVRVSFLCSETGKPKSVAIADSSGFSELDAAALRAVRMIPTLHPLPQGLKHDQRYQAVLLFATSQASHDRQLVGIPEDAARRNAWFGDGGTPIALGVSLMPVG
ncbi:energy transducer TonB [Sphingomonas sp. PL-96]|uniref:energy transducer TonB n=1 Tax=Sphingomonas sp. PL-96 TaxID=2887201 RepID=UPI001E2E6784|nr:energy transducer TonB [Sphingomonas sp. PL-96]MCC2977620.1 energy transducer TonB [Sphingomonas sp. PL-96]